MSDPASGAPARPRSPSPSGQLPAALLTLAAVAHLDPACGEEVAEPVRVVEAALRPELTAQNEDGLDEGGDPLPGIGVPPGRDLAQPGDHPPELGPAAVALIAGEG